jgi:hypothetical protein
MRFAAVVAALALTATAVPTALAAPAVRYAHPVLGPAVTDGTGFVVYDLPDGTTYVRNEAAGEEYSLPSPAGCRLSLVAAGGGQALWAPCGYSNGAPVSTAYAQLLDVRTRAFHEPAGMDELARRHSSVQWNGVGSHWLIGSTNEFGGGRATVNQLAFNWRTGATAENEPPGPRRVADLNRAALGRKLCRPLRRRRIPPNPDFESAFPPFRPYWFARPFGVATVADGGLTLDRCGSRRRMRITRSAYPTTVQVGAGYVTWADARHVHAYRLATGERRRWRRPKSDYVTVAHTAKTVYVTVGEGPKRPLYTAKPRWRSR